MRALVLMLALMSAPVWATEKNDPQFCKIALELVDGRRDDAGDMLGQLAGSPADYSDVFDGPRLEAMNRFATMEQALLRALADYTSAAAEAQLTLGGC